MKRIAIILVLLGCSVAVAKPFAPTSFAVSVAGSGRPIILIPGLGCPGSVWDDTVAHFKGAQTHVLTLAGYAGLAPIDKPLSATVRAELAAYIRDRKLDHPIVIGHSLGGFIAFWLAETIRSSSGPRSPSMRSRHSASIRRRSRRSPRWPRPGRPWRRPTSTQQVRDMFLAMATDAKRIEPVIAAVLKSDRRTFADSFVELFKTDLRPQLGKIRRARPRGARRRPVPAADHDAGRGNPVARGRVLPKTRHFVMFDDPAGFFRAVDAFLR